MQEHTNKDQDFTKARRTNPIHIVEGARLGTPNAETLRDVHMSLVRAEQNLFNLVQANQASNGATFGYATPPAFPAGYAPGFAPGFGPAGIPTPGALTYGVPPTPWTTTPSAPWASPTLAAAWNPMGNGMAGTAIVAPGFPSHAWGSVTTGPLAGRIPACDISDEGKQFVCQLDLPGLRADQVELLCSEHAVVVSAYRESETDIASLLQSERGTATLQRTIALPTEILPGGVKATLSNGVLTVVLPKAQPTEGPRRVKVQG